VPRFFSSNFFHYCSKIEGIARLILYQAIGLQIRAFDTLNVVSNFSSKSTFSIDNFGHYLFDPLEDQTARVTKLETLRF